ncbi:MAG: MBL fold metallo-hydrolase [Nitrososphaeria archaeon]|nr:MBL fold metallo-hydrolase [Nitrososphaeria archaeon]NIN51566.1 MBL fold metallo-hydrolase [Nitrososphaeria archaeon]NIQ32332.1 MBL fold metallo-hydrolase [Nitrososphaeria archaeon]
MDRANILRLGSKVQGLRETWIIPGVGLSSNVYVIGSLPITLIDTGIGGEKDQLGENLRSAVIFTHAHFDHTSGLKELLRYKTPIVYIHEQDYYGLRRVLSKGLKHKKLEGGEIIDTTYPLHVIHTPGHTRGSICLYHKDSGSVFRINLANRF